METFTTSYAYMNTLTGSPIVTIPYSFTTFGWWNCPMMAASLMNFTLSFSPAPSLKVFRATSIMLPFGVLHVPLFTFPNSPHPRCPNTLWEVIGQWTWHSSSKMHHPNMTNVMADRGIWFNWYWESCSYNCLDVLDGSQKFSPFTTVVVRGWTDWTFMNGKIKINVADQRKK